MNKYLKILIIFITVSNVSAQNQGTTKSEAHFMRAKSLLLAALREFDEGANASPEISINSSSWKSEVRDKANELERIISPRARMSTSGAKFDAYPQLLSESKQ